MIAKRVIYRNFRNISEAEIEFSPGVNVLIGNNAEGKTNALEGIYLMASGKSFRSPRERDMVKFGESFFEASLIMEDSEREQELYFKAYSGEITKRRECKKNGVTLSKISELIGVFRAVLFCPEHLAIVKAGPSERRSFLDIAICQLKPVYLKSLQKFNKILTQRNALLKQISDGIADESLLEVYSEQLARESAFIYRTRYEYIKRLSEFVKVFFSELSKSSGDDAREVPELVYKNSLKITEQLSEAEAYEHYIRLLKTNTIREIGAGVTLYGSHKDDIEIYLDSKEARQFASQGQQRSLALAMKLGEGEISKEYSGEYPVFLFDDVLSELDPKRQRFLLSKLGDRQVIMTTCTPPPVESDAHFVSVEGGRYLFS
ncbi:MAG: DNA replication/repair protein RecF [Clostridia bacterium]|nr:DNA replication/repair protein RecF [Clostridia bacterium]